MSIVTFIRNKRITTVTKKLFTMSPFLIIVLVLGLFILLSSFFTVKQQTAVVIERFGKFTSIRSSTTKY
jgi:regulator of protease activity HflC (stomatin/prohibitin superfamily)